MHILYVSPYFPPEMGAPSARVSELARAWVRQGHKVTVLTGFANHPTGVKAPADHGVITRRETWEGVDVVRCYLYAAANKGTAKRMASYASFMLTSPVIGLFRVSKPDIVVGTSPHLLCPVGAYILARLKGAPFVFEVRDLWPEAITAVGAMKPSLPLRILKKVSAYLYKHSDAIVTVGTGYKRGIVAGYGTPEDKIQIVPNGADLARFVPGQRDNDIRKEFGWGDDFVALYLGTHGMAHGLDTILAAANLMRDKKGVRFVFVGEGAEKDLLIERSKQMGLTNVQFIGQQSKDRVPGFYAACDIGVVVLRDTDLFREVLPSKLFEYLAMERPVVLGVAGEAKELVDKANAGRHIKPESAEELAQQVQWFMDNPAERASMGKSGRDYVLANYDREKLAGTYLHILNQIKASIK